MTEEEKIVSRMNEYNNSRPLRSWILGLPIFGLLSWLAYSLFILMKTGELPMPEFVAQIIAVSSLIFLFNMIRLEYFKAVLTFDKDWVVGSISIRDEKGQEINDKAATESWVNYIIAIVDLKIAIYKICLTFPLAVCWILISIIKYG